jgi:PKHD-type hydroxylase
MSWMFHSDQVNPWAYIEKIFTPEECQKIIDYAYFQEQYDGLIANDQLNIDIRENKISWINPNPDTNWIYEKISDGIMHINSNFFNFELNGIIEPMQFTEYNKVGSKYKAHVDSCWGGIIRKLTICIQLSDPKDYEGGNLDIFTSANPTSLPKEQGTLIAFPSYTLHEVKSIVKGCRYSLVAWVTGDKFK